MRSAFTINSTIEPQARPENRKKWESDCIRIPWTGSIAAWAFAHFEDVSEFVVMTLGCPTAILINCVACGSKQAYITFE